MPNLAENTSIDQTTSPQNNEAFSYRPLIVGLGELRKDLQKVRLRVKKMSEVLDAVDLKDGSAANPPRP